MQRTDRQPWRAWRVRPRSSGSAAIAAVGTAGLRMARQRRGRVVDAVSPARCGVAVEVISGEEEARLAFLAATSGLPAPGSRPAVSSTPVEAAPSSPSATAGRWPNGSAWTSGAVRCADPDSGLDLHCGSLECSSRCAPPSPPTCPASTATSLTGRASWGWAGRSPTSHAVKLGLQVLRTRAGARNRARPGRTRPADRPLYRSRDAHARRAVVGLQPARAEVILAGACIVRTIIDKLGLAELTVSDRGLRHGVLVERFGPHGTSSVESPERPEGPPSGLQTMRNFSIFGLEPPDSLTDRPRGDESGRLACQPLPGGEER